MADIDETQKILRTIINNQSSFRQEVLSKIDKLDEKLSGRIDNLDVKIGGVEKRLAERMDKIGILLYSYNY